MSHQTRSLPDHWFLIAHGARAHGVARSVANSVPMARVRGVAHPTLTPLRREKLLHRKDGASRQHVIDGASNLVREDRQRLPLSVFLLQARQ